MTMNIILAIIAALCGLTVVGAGAITAYKWFISGTDIRRSRNTSLVALALTVLTGIGAIAPWPAAAPLGETTNADNPGLNITLDDVEVSMSGFGTKAQVLAYLQQGFGDKFDEAMTTCTDWDFLPVDAEGNSVDQAKLLANKEYLEAIGYGKEYPDGFRNAVEFPSNVLTAEVYNRLSEMTEDELDELYDDHRWLDVNWYTMTSLRFADMRLQRMETFVEFNEQNSMWAPAFREIIDRAKEDPEFLETLYVTEADGSRHLNEEIQIYCGMLCMSEESAVITGIEAPRSTTNWELPWSSDAESRWTVRLDEPDQQEELPAFIWDYPSLKSGLRVYKTGYNISDLRSERFDPNEDPVKPATPPKTPPTDPGKPDVIPNNPTTRVITAHYVEEGTGATVHQDTTHKFTVGKQFSVGPLNITGYTYKRSEGLTSGTMPDYNFEVTFYYTKNADTSLVTLTVEHRDADTNALLESGSYKVAKGSTQTLSADYSGDGYIYLNNNQGNSKSRIDVTVNGDMTVIFYYYKEYRATVRHLDVDTNEPVASESYLYGRQGTSYTARALTNLAGYTYVRNSKGNTNTTVTGDFPANNNAVVTFYYKKNVESFTATAYYRAIDSNHNLIDPVVQTVQAGQPYSTDQKSFPGYRFRYTTGDATSGTMPTRNVTVTYWYELIEQDGNNNKRPESDPTQNGTGNANPPKGPDDTTELETWQPEDPDTGERVPEQTGDEYSSNQNQDKTPGAGSDERQEVSNTPVGATDEKTDGMSSGTGGQDHPVTGDNVQNDTPTDKTDPDPVVDTDWSQDNGGNQTDTILPPP